MFMLVRATNNMCIRIFCADLFKPLLFHIILLKILTKFYKIIQNSLQCHLLAEMETHYCCTAYTNVPDTG